MKLIRSSHSLRPSDRSRRGQIWQWPWRIPEVDTGQGHHGFSSVRPTASSLPSCRGRSAASPDPWLAMHPHHVVVLHGRRGKWTDKSPMETKKRYKSKLEKKICRSTSCEIPTEIQCTSSESRTHLQKKFQQKNNLDLDREHARYNKSTWTRVPQTLNQN